VSRTPSPDLDAESQIELAALKRALRLADGFTLHVARANTTVLRQQIVADLRANLPRPLVELTLSRGEPPEMVYEQIARVSERAPAGAVISVDGLDVLAPSRDPDWFLRQLNWRRAAYRRLARPLLLWVPEYLLRLMMRHAPDFFDWHSGFYEFTTPETALGETIRQTYAVGDAEQVDLTAAQKRERIATLRGLLDEYVGEEPEISRARASLLGKLGILYYSLGEVARAVEYYEDALTIAREIGDRRGEGNRLGNLGNAYRALGEVARAIEYYEQALAIAREIGDRRGEGNSLGNLGNAYSALGEVSRVIEYYEEALAIAREIGDRRGEAFCCWNLGLLYEDADPARAARLMQVCVDYEREIGHPDAKADAARVEEIRRRLANSQD
jgi:tetratricopeptide (TPR) repeat protein